MVGGEGRRVTDGAVAAGELWPPLGVEGWRQGGEVAAVPPRPQVVGGRQGRSERWVIGGGGGEGRRATDGAAAANRAFGLSRDQWRLRSD
jgi:hypothetical protein